MSTTPFGAPSVLRSWNARAILEDLSGAGPSTRPQLAARTGLSKPTISQAVAGLLAAGVIREVGVEGGRRGPAAIRYDIDVTCGHVLAIDTGRARIRAALADLSGDIIARAEQRSPHTSLNGLVGAIDTLTSRVCNDVGITREDLTQVVCAVPGAVDDGPQSVALVSNLPALAAPHAMDRIRSLFPAPVCVDNDANLAAIGEQRFGAAQGLSSSATVIIGSGLGMGLVINGELVRGATGAAGEIGFLPLERDPGRGKKGKSLETRVGAAALVRSARSAGLTGVRTAKDVFAAAAAGNQVAREVVAVEAKDIAYAIACVIAVTEPEVVILGGGIALSGEALLEPLTAQLRRIAPFSPPVVLSSIGDDATLLGAIAVGSDRARDLVFTEATRPDASDMRRTS